MRAPALLLMMFMLAGPGSFAADDPAAARAGFARERNAIDAAFRQAEAACRDKFAVNTCLEQARGDRRKALAQVRAAELALDDTQRQQRAAERRRAVLEKQAELQQRVASAPAAAASAASAASAAASRSPRPARPAAAPLVVKPPRSGAASAPVAAEVRGGNAPLDGGAEAAAARASAAAARTREFEARQARIAEREKERAATSRPVSPLPLPVPASAPR